MRISKNKNIKILQGEVAIPDIVEQKTEDVFCAIQAGKISRGMPPEHMPARKMSGRKAWAAAAAVAFAMGTITAGAAVYTKWSRSLDSGLQATESMRQELEENHAWSAPNQSVTIKGITITAKECIVDNYNAYISFKIKGYDLPEGRNPWFFHTSAEVGGKSMTSFDTILNYSFYCGLITDANGDYIYDDGTPYEGDPFNYIMDDGSLEYRMELTAKEKGFFLGKPIHVKLVGLGSVDGKSGILYATRDGKRWQREVWEFDWVLSGTAASTEIALHEPLGSTGAAVTGIEISPISLRVTYDFKYQEASETYYDAQAKKERQYTHVISPPTCFGVRTKDGKWITQITGSGSGSWGDFTNTFTETQMLNRIIDAKQIDALLFIDSGTDYKFVKDDPDKPVYIVPVNIP